MKKAIPVLSPFFWKWDTISKLRYCTIDSSWSL